MFLYKTRRHARRVKRFSGLLTENPVLTLGLALPFVIAASFSLQAAVCILLGMAAITVPMMLAASLAGRFLPAFLRIPLYGLGSIALLIPVESWLTEMWPVTVNSLGVYLPILAVNTLMLYQCEAARTRKVHRVLLDALLQVAGFAVVILLVGTLREVLGNGTLWGEAVPWVTFKLTGLLIPFGGCILVAFIGATSKYIGRLMRAGLYRSDLKAAEWERRASAQDEALDQEVTE